MERTKTTPNEYIKSLPDEKRKVIQTLYKAISKAIPGIPQVMWEGKFWGGSDQNIIGFGEYSYIRSDKKSIDWFIVGLTHQKGHISVYVNAVEDNQYLAEQYKDKLGKVKGGKSSITFKKLEDVNLQVLIKVIKKAISLS